MSRLFLLVLMVSIIGIASAGTVTFIGTCTQNVTSQNHLSFNISNIGNDTAYTIRMNPVVAGASQPPAFTANSLGPGQHYTFSLNLTNVTALGSYVDYIPVTYQQGPATFTAIFPCLLNFGPIARANSVLSYQLNNTNGQYQINASVYNFGNYTFNASVSLILPQGFIFLSPRSVNLTVPSLETKYVHFLLSNPGPGPSSGVIESQYVNDGIHYAGMEDIEFANAASVSAGSSSISLSRSDLFALAAVLIVILFVVLIIRAQLRKRRHQKARESS